jgi:hypothetical protein
LLEKLLDVTPIPYSLEHGIEIMHPLFDSNRQYDSGGLSSESRGNSLLFSVSSMQRNSVAMRQSPDSVDSETYLRQSESNSGCGGPEVHLSKGWTSVTTTEDEAVVWEEQEYKPPTFE